MTFASPGNQSESVKVADLANHLLIITPVEYKTGIQTVHGIAEAVEVNVYDLDTNTAHNSLLWFNVALRNALKTKLNQKVLARIGQGAYLAATPAPVATAVPAPVPAGLESLSPEVAALLAQLGAKP